jgi:hypothetical protein
MTSKVRLPVAKDVPEVEAAGEGARSRFNCLTADLQQQEPDAGTLEFMRERRLCDVEVTGSPHR